MADIGKVAVIPKGDYQAGTDYESIDIVRHNNASWLSVRATNAEPSENNNDWLLLSRDGTDGFSPSVETEKVDGVTTVTVTDSDGTHDFEIIDGTNGEDGEDGISPTVSISKNGKVTTITITDKDGEHTATINDGEDGDGTGDMLKSVYDPDDDGIVDNASSVNWSGVQNVPYDSTPTANSEKLMKSGDIKNALDGKQDSLTEGSGIEINGDNVISAKRMTGATASKAGEAGMVPAPAIGDADKVLKGDGTWGEAATNIDYLKIVDGMLCVVYEG